ncbi:MAG: type II secretion system major pseudopilin GspG [Planctomycetota bacterium]
MTTPLRWRRRGFTLIELLLVMVIIAVLAALVIPSFVGRGEQAKKGAAETQIKSLFGTALDTYEVDNGSYPTTNQGLEALRAKPSAAPEPKQWSGPYLKSDVPDDPWGNPYNYRSPGQHNAQTYDLSSMGPDGREGTEDDITNW